MIICFVRHGKAEEKKPGQSDEERRLTEEGRRGVELVARALPLERVTRIYTSPLVRARESAEIVARVRGGEIVVTDALHPSKASLEELKKLEIAEGTVFIGHAPSIENIVSEIIGGGAIKMKAGAAACIDLGEKSLDKGSGVLIALIPPQALEKLTKNMVLR